MTGDIRAILIGICPDNDMKIVSECPWEPSHVQELLLHRYRVLGTGPAEVLPAIRYQASNEELLDSLQVLCNDDLCEVPDWDFLLSVIDEVSGVKQKRAPKRQFPFEIDHISFDEKGRTRNTAKWDANEAWRATMAMVGAALSKGE